MRRIKDRTFIGGTPLYSRFQRGGRVCGGYKDGRAHNEVGALVWQVMVASRLITAVSSLSDRSPYPAGRCLSYFPAVMSAQIHEVAEANPRPETGAGTRCGRHMRVRDRVAPMRAPCGGTAPALALPMLVSRPQHSWFSYGHICLTSGHALSALSNSTWHALD